MNRRGFGVSCGMLPEIEQLLILQDKDQVLRRLRNDLKKMPPDAEAAKARLAGATAAVAATKEEAQRNEVAIKSLELQIQTRRDTIVKLKTQQFETRKNEEFTALAHETARYEKDVAKLEDEEMGLMETGEVWQAKLQEALAHHAETEALVKEELGKIKQRYLNVTAQIKEFEGLRGGLAAQVPGELLERGNRGVEWPRLRGLPHEGHRGHLQRSSGGETDRHLSQLWAHGVHRPLGRLGPTGAVKGFPFAKG